MTLRAKFYSRREATLPQNTFEIEKQNTDLVPSKKKTSYQLIQVTSDNCLKQQLIILEGEYLFLYEREDNFEDNLKLMVC